MYDKRPKPYETLEEVSFILIDDILPRPSEAPKEVSFFIDIDGTLKETRDSLEEFKIIITEDEIQPRQERGYAKNQRTLPKDSVIQYQANNSTVSRVVRKAKPTAGPSRHIYQPAANVLIGIITAVIVIFVASFAFLSLSPDFDLAIIRGPSMEPTIKLGSLAVVQNNPLSVEPGDIIAFDMGFGAPVIHRMVSVGSSTIKTKGDNLEQEDFWEISRGDVVGKYLFSVPFLGYVSSFLGTRLGTITCVLIPSFLICIFLLYSIIKEVKVYRERRFITKSLPR